MMRARRTSVWKRRYEITTDGHPLAIWDGAVWKTGGSFEFDGRRYESCTSGSAGRVDAADEHVAQRCGR